MTGDVKTKIHGSKKNHNTLLVLKTLKSKPKSVKEISEECNISLPTTHRIINKLLERNLLKKSGTIDERGVKKRLFYIKH